MFSVSGHQLIHLMVDRVLSDSFLSDHVSCVVRNIPQNFQLNLPRHGATRRFSGLMSEPEGAGRGDGLDIATPISGRVVDMAKKVHDGTCM